MRCFVGVWIGAPIRNEIVSIQRIIKTLPIIAKFVEKQNLHITLSFLGNRGEDELKDLIIALKGISRKYKKFHVKIRGIKLIPSQNFIRVLALGIENSEVLHKLSREISQKLHGDYKPPHITLCRVKAIMDKNAILEFYKQHMELEIGNLEISSFSLIQSVLTPKGPIYKTIETFELEDNE